MANGSERLRIAVSVVCLLVVGNCGGGGGRVRRLADPEIIQFHVSQDRLKVGEEATLDVSFLHGEGRIEPDIGRVASSGSVKVKPWTTTTYALTVTNQAGVFATKALTVTVDPALIVSVSGLDRAAAAIDIEGPEGYRRSLKESATLLDLLPGEYTIRAGETADVSPHRHPWLPVQKIQVASGTKAAVIYPESAITIELPGKVPMEFVLIPAGTFQMGTQDPDEIQMDHWPKPTPLHRVTISKAFYMAKFLTTRRQWRAMTGADPSPLPGEPDFPADHLNYGQIQRLFVDPLNTLAPGHAFRLPSEAQWEYACRAGTQTRYFFGKDETRFDDFYWRFRTSGRTLHPVGQKQPNQWGLYDLGGMCYQWCEDLAHDDYAGAPEDGRPWLGSILGPLAEKEVRILRGGNPYQDSGRSARRLGMIATGHFPFMGFRVIASEMAASVGQ